MNFHHSLSVSFVILVSFFRMVSDRHDRPPGAELQGRCADCMRVILCHTPRLHCTVRCDKHHSLTERTLSPEHHISITANGVHLSLVARILTAWGHFALKKPWLDSFRSVGEELRYSFTWSPVPCLS